MALDEKQRQKKLAKRKAQRTERQRRSAAAEAGYSSAQAVQFPLHECLVPANLFEVGVGNALLSRSLPNGDLAVAAFLLDVYCRGVKTAFYRTALPQEYELNLRRFEGSTQLTAIAPACLRKLIEGAVDYARTLGLEPASDYARAAKLFGDIDAATCPAQYTYGRHGKPLYISGPRHSPAQVRRILNLLGSDSPQLAA